MVFQLPGMWETNNSAGYSFNDLVKFGLSDDYYKTYDTIVRKLTLTELQQISKLVVNSGLVK